MRDFSLKIYESLLQTLLEKNYSFYTLQDFIKLFTPSPCHPVTSPLIILRHDVDRCPQNALKMAELEAEMGVKASYYFRIPKIFKPEIIKQIAELGHEIGYHYENLSEISRKLEGRSRKEEAGRKKALFEKALQDFEKNLRKLRELCSVKTICMHGSPLSKWDNRDLWKKYDYRNFGIIAEPYFDIDFNEVFYITDTGRRWNNKQVSIRDKVESKFSFTINATQDIIKLLNLKDAPNKIMFNIHPEHWADSNVEWLKIWCIRKVKNAGKRMMVRRGWGV